MAFGLMGIAGILPSLVALIAQWIGVLAMKHRKGRGWWLMLIGVGISTLGPVLGLLGMLLGAANVHSSGMGFYVVMAGFGLGAAGGAVTFGIGFALHALGLNAAAERQQQLEAMTAAMAEELRQLRGN